MDDELQLPRRKVLAGLGTIGVASAGAGMGTMAYLNDTEVIKDNTVTAGELDLKLDWANFYWGDKLYTDYQPPADSPGPMYTINDAKPGDFGGGCISLHVRDNPAFIWAACNLDSNAENGVNEPESGSKDEDDPIGENSGGRYSGELAQKIKVALLRYPISYTPDNIETEANAVKEAIRDDGDLTEAEFQEIQSGCRLIYKTNLKDLCKNKLHNGHLLDGGDAIDLSTSGTDGNGDSGKCFEPSTTYWYCFLWWIPMEVGNEIQSDSVQFDLKFGAVQCRHVRNPGRYNPFADRNSSGEATSDGSGSTETEESTT